MSNAPHADRALKLESRAVIRLGGAEAKTFLNGLVTNDVEKVAPGKAIYAGLLTPQGKYLFDLIVFEDGATGDLLLDVEAARVADLTRKLMLYRLRTPVEIEPTERSVWAILGNIHAGDSVASPDPRHPDLGWRALLEPGVMPDAAPLDLATYEQNRLLLGVPDGSRDMAVEKDFWLETGAERLNGVAFDKGCYVGQELTARMKHRTSVKKLVVPVEVEGGAPAPGTEIVTADGKAAGEIRSGHGDHALAWLRLEYGDDQLAADGKPVTLIR
ncbi:YgfZ/GcvT domain-containing protein [Gimibacter soli]|uniref:CAF17 C-terminal domain-containing protein n=1 Tax=Gimibacter soli TaxID=3024400 RepID=A0AAF0BK21_9PROT|nr:hypothetical protein [Gimibacter soli]WCL53789.1 hypothetical protein PH603_14710 [Gimibacter soli]